MSKKRARVPGTPSARRGGWKHISSVLYDARGTVLADGERISAAITLPDTGEKQRGKVGILHVRCSGCGGRLRAGSYVLPEGVSVLCERCSGGR